MKDNYVTVLTHYGIAVITAHCSKFRIITEIFRVSDILGFFLAYENYPESKQYH